MWTLNPDRSSAVLYRDMLHSHGNFVPRISILPVMESTLLFAFFFNFWADSAIILDANFARFMTDAQ